MIKIEKGNPPQELVDIAENLTDELKLKYDNNQGDYQTGVQKFTFTKDYTSDIIKQTLKDRQHNKCCFSESKFSGDYPDVEHFRPKGRVDYKGTKTKQYPGYYWLAYDWENLFYCKSRINCSYKKNFFPLDDETKRNKSHHDTNLEESIFINPALEDPRDHIRFYKDEPIKVTDKGLANIELLGLRHSDFAEERRTLFRLLESLKAGVDLAIAGGIDTEHPTIQGSISLLREAVKPEAKFSSMSIDFLSEWPHL